MASLVKTFWVYLSRIRVCVCGKLPACVCLTNKFPKPSVWPILTFRQNKILLTYWLTYSMEQSPSWEANGFSASQEIPHTFWNPNHYRIHKCPPPVPISVWTVRNMIRFDSEELLAPRSTPKLEVHHLSAVHDCLCNIFEATLHIGGSSSIRNLRTRHVVVTATHLSLN